MTTGVSCLRTGKETEVYLEAGDCRPDRISAAGEFGFLPEEFVNQRRRFFQELGTRPLRPGHQRGDFRSGAAPFLGAAGKL